MQVVQETEEGGERVEEPGALEAAAAAVADAATAAAHKVEGLAAGAYHAVVKEAPGADVSGEGAPVKGWAEGAQETGGLLRQREGQVGMQQAVPGERPRPESGGSAAAAGLGSGGSDGRTGQAVKEGGYDSDSEGTGPVLKGVTHTAGHGGIHEAGAKGSGGGGGPSAGSPRRHGHTHGHGDSDRSAAVVAGEAAAASHKHAVQGLFTRALEAAEELAATAAGKLKHGAQLAAGTAPEQHPADQLTALQESIARMEGERAEDVAYQKAKKELGIAMEGLRALQQRLLSQTGSWVGAGAQGHAASAADGAPAPPAAARLLAWLTHGRAGREPVLPVRKPKPKSSSPIGSPPGSRRLLRGGGSRAGLQRALRAALLLLMVAAAAACTVAAAAALYYRSIIYEPADALAAATAEVQQALRAAGSAAVWPAGAPSLAAEDDLKPPGPAAIDVLRAAEDPPIEESPAPQPLWTANYTVVVMSYAARLRTLPLVVNKMGSCPSVAEVLIVWNGEDPPPPSHFRSRAPVRVRQETQMDLSNRLRADEGIRTAAVFLCDDDVLLRCADVERAFARWLAAPQALVGFFPRLLETWSPPQYHGEQVAFARGRYNAMLTATEFVGLDVLKRYWTERYGWARWVVGQKLNCEDLLLNWAAAEGIRENFLAAQPIPPLGKPQQAPAGPERWPPHAVWVQPSRRLDISLLSGLRTGISRRRAAHEATRRECVGMWTNAYGDLLQEEKIEWQGNAAGAGRSPGGLHAPLLPAASPVCQALHVQLPSPGGAAAAAAAPSSSPQREQAAAASTKRELQGLLLNALATVFGAGMSLFAKISGREGVGVFEIVLTRSFILLLFTTPDLLRHRVNPFEDPRRRWLLVLRGVLGFLAVSFLYWSVSLLPLAMASTLSFISPIFVAALSPLILREKTPSSLFLGIATALVGMLLVVQPPFLFGGQSGNISLLGVTVGVCQALFNSLSRITVRALSKDSSERMSSIIFGQGLIGFLAAAVACIATGDFQTPSRPRIWGPLLAGGLLGYFYQLALTAGLRLCRAAPAVSLSYLTVIWGLLSDTLLFHQTPNAVSCVGAVVICLSSFFVAQSTGQKSQKGSATAATATAAGGSSESRGGSPAKQGAAADVEAAAEADGDEEDRPLLAAEQDTKGEQQPQPPQQQQAPPGLHTPHFTTSADLEASVDRLARPTDAAEGGSPTGTAPLQGVGVQGDALDQLAEQQAAAGGAATAQPPPLPPAAEVAAGQAAGEAPAAAAGQEDALDSLMRSAEHAAPVVSGHSGHSGQSGPPNSTAAGAQAAQGQSSARPAPSPFLRLRSMKGSSPPIASSLPHHTTSDSKPETGSGGGGDLAAGSDADGLPLAVAPSAAAADRTAAAGGSGLEAGAAGPEAEAAGEVPVEKKRRRRWLLLLLFLLLLLLLLGGGIGIALAVGKKKAPAAAPAVAPPPSTGIYQSGSWMPQASVAAKVMGVIPGPTNETAYVINACYEGFYFNGSLWRMIAGPFDASAAAPAPAPAPAAVQALPYGDGGSGGSGGGASAAVASRRLRQQAAEAQGREGVDLSLSPPDMPAGMVDGVVVSDGMMWALLPSRTETGDWAVKAPLPACSAVYDGVYNGSVQSFAANAHGGSYAEFVDIGSGSTSGLTACACGAISTFDVGFLNIGGSPYVATVGFTCESGQQQPDPAATGLALSSSATAAAALSLTAATQPIAAPAQPQPATTISASQSEPAATLAASQPQPTAALATTQSPTSPPAVTGKWNCTVGWWRRLGGSTMANPSITTLSGPQMIFRFTETVSTTRSASTCGCGYDSVLLIFDAGAAGPTTQTINSPTAAGPGKVFAAEGVTFLQCVDDEGDQCTGANTWLTPAYNASAWPSGCTSDSATCDSLPGRASFVTFPTTVGRIYLVVVADWDAVATTYRINVW
ncbi:Solute carrier family 35 member G1 [Chlorella sorokiniana]|uniref:Solute carrier family 35 member G1 n=1 Tax=Chlorella sorokiniana TaxID=3076 RepID=A0A2P6THF7_CHLSO|nr:Solute carrier family 35 member G1 [Chlorella sorokiniana]|eukprot:PRW33720.1 Solute carrier family 35 member G1 [Chlorella sorokiniana]